MLHASVLLETNDIISSHPTLPGNALSILEKLSGMPSTDSFGTADSGGKSQGPQFWVEELNTKLKSQTKKSSDENEDEDSHEDDKEDDWQLFFEDLKESSATSKKEKESRGRRRRVYALSVQDQLHTPAAHRAVFTRCWLSLIPLLTSPLTIQHEDEDEEQEHLALVTRALVVLHRGVLPYLTRPVLIMDWVAGCVDHGLSSISLGLYLLIY